MLPSAKLSPFRFELRRHTHIFKEVRVACRSSLSASGDGASQCPGSVPAKPVRLAELHLGDRRARTEFGFVAVDHQSL